MPHLQTWSFTTINLSEDKATITWTSGDGASNGDVGTMTDLKYLQNLWCQGNSGIGVDDGKFILLPEVHPASDVSDGLANITFMDTTELTLLMQN